MVPPIKMVDLGMVDPIALLTLEMTRIRPIRRDGDTRGYLATEMGEHRDVMGINWDRTKIVVGKVLYTIIGGNETISF